MFLYILCASWPCRDLHNANYYSIGMHACVYVCVVGRERGREGEWTQLRERGSEFLSPYRQMQSMGEMGSVPNVYTYMCLGRILSPLVSLGDSTSDLAAPPQS